ncbi:hypothetical protein AMTRI_Chr13g122390 [Amborella trichopoda]
MTYSKRDLGTAMGIGKIPKHQVHEWLKAVSKIGGKAGYLKDGYKKGKIPIRGWCTNRWPPYSIRAELVKRISSELMQPHVKFVLKMCEDLPLAIIVVCLIKLH